MSTEESNPGSLLVEGKTKRIFLLDNSVHRGAVTVQFTDNITAGDGAQRDTFEGCGMHSNTIAVNVFELLRQAGVPVAFTQKRDDTSYIAPRCRMLPYEVVIRRYAMGSYLKRNPHSRDGERFGMLVFEVFLKTTNRKFNNLSFEFPVDDPLIDPSSINRIFYRPDNFWQFEVLHPDVTKPYVITSIEPKDIFTYKNEILFFARMKELAEMAFLVLERAWNVSVGATLIDFKLEFGVPYDIDPSKAGPEDIVLADPVTNAEWRLLFPDGEDKSKQGYRDHGLTEQVKRNLAEVAKASGKMRRAFGPGTE